MTVQYLYWVAEYVGGKPSGKYYPLQTVRNNDGSFDTYIVKSMVQRKVLASMNVIGYCWQQDDTMVIEYFGGR